MATQNRYQVGTLYYPGGPAPHNYFTQPGGPGTQVFPAQPNGQPWPAWPAAGEMVYSFGAWWQPQCLHYVSAWNVIREYDYDNSTSVALICCPVCSLVQTVYTPFEAWLDPIQHSIIVA